MDPLALANLPLTTLALVAIFWILTQLIGWASARIEDQRARAARRSKFLYHAQFSYAVFAASIASVQETAADEIAAENEKAPPRKPDPLLLQAAETALRFLGMGAANVAPSPSKPEGSLFTVTSGHMDFRDVADNLHRYEEGRAGLVLFLIEEMPMIEAMIEEVNALAGKPDKRLDLVGALLSLQFVLFGACIVAHTLLDDTFFKKIDAVVKANGDFAERARAVLRLVRSDLPTLTLPKIAAKDDQGKYTLATVTEDNIAEYLPFFRVSALDVMLIRAPVNWAWVWAGLPVAALLVFGAVLAASEDARDWLYPRSDDVTCEVKTDAQGAVIETKCTFDAETLPEGLEQGRSLSGSR